MLFKHVALERMRLESVDLNNRFHEGLDSHLSKLVEFYRAKSGGGMELKHLLDSLDSLLYSYLHFGVLIIAFLEDVRYTTLEQNLMLSSRRDISNES